MTRRRSALLTAPLVALALVAAVPAASAAPRAPAPADQRTEATTRRHETVDPAEAQLRWVMSLLNGRPVTEHAYLARFAPSFREAVPMEVLRLGLDGLRATGPYEVHSVEPTGERGLVARIVDTLGVGWEVELSVTPTGQVDLLEPRGPGGVAQLPGSLHEVARRLDRLGAVRMVAAEVEGTSCSPIAGRGAWKPAPIASVFKLYVLGAVADAVAAGDLAWGDELTVTADVRSLSSAGLQDRPDGSTVTVREAAQLMISLSDNTASDLLLRTVGRPAVERAQAAYGHRSPGLNEPFPTTRELFLLKASPRHVRAGWIHGSERVRRAILHHLADADLEAGTEGLFADGPVEPHRIEVFASPLDVCRALATLIERAAAPGLEPLLEILTANPGIPDEGGRWSTVAYKGGSEPGLIVGAWLVEDDRGRRFAVVGSVVNPRREVGEVSPLLLLAAGRDLLGADGSTDGRAG